MLLVVLSALAWDDCGIAAGQRWWITRDGLVSDDGTTRIENWSTCDIPASVTLGVLYNEHTDAIDVEDKAKLMSTAKLLLANTSILRVRVEIHMDTSGDPKIRGDALVVAARELLTANGIAPERVEIVNRGASTPLVTPEVTDADRARNRRVDVVVVQVGSP